MLIDVDYIANTIMLVKDYGVIMFFCLNKKFVAFRISSTNIDDSFQWFQQKGYSYPAQAISQNMLAMMFGICINPCADKNIKTELFVVAWFVFMEFYMFITSHWGGKWLMCPKVQHKFQFNIFLCERNQKISLGLGMVIKSYLSLNAQPHGLYRIQNNTTNRTTKKICCQREE